MHRRDAQQLKLVKRDPLFAEESIDDVDRDVERFRLQTELNLNNYEPVYQNFSLGRPNLRLLLQVVWVRHKVKFCPREPVVDLILVLEVDVLTEKTLRVIAQITQKT